MSVPFIGGHGHPNLGYFVFKISVGYTKQGALDTNCEGKIRLPKSGVRPLVLSVLTRPSVVDYD